MKSYLKLVDFEVKRFWKIYAVLIALLVALQPISMLISMNGITDELKRGVFAEANMTDFTQSILFVIPIAMCVGALVVYVFATWYLEWFGKNTFAYQLLLLPVNRLSIYLAKLTSLLLFIMGCVVVQLAIYPLLRFIYIIRIPEQYQDELDIISWLGISNYLDFLIPVPGANFITYYGLGIAIVIVVFTMIVLERSFRLKGIMLAILYAIGCLLLFLLADFIEMWFLPLYVDEYTVIKVVSTIIMIALSVWISFVMMNKKISV
ncbi:MAG: hypothetical protein ACI4XS_12065 [Bacillus sp. (in: firmicutes)]